MKTPQKTQTRIYKRLTPCNCGCQGQDPWHRRYFKRVLKNVREIAPQNCNTTLGVIEVVMEAEASLPWGTTRVVGELIAPNTYFWVIDKDAMLDGMS